MHFSSLEGEHRYADLVRVADRTIVGLDFDGTLSPIVDDPARAHIHPEAAEVLIELAPQVGAIAVVTGRPAGQALDLGGLEEVGDAIQAAGKEIFLFDQYGNERWSSRQRRIVAPDPRGASPRFSVTCRGPSGWPGRRTPTSRTRASRWPSTPAAARPEAASSGCCAAGELAERHGMVVEPGRSVIEVRSPGSHKARSSKSSRTSWSRGFLFAGDDLGDLEAFEAVGRAGEAGSRGAPGLLGVAGAERAAGTGRHRGPGPEGVVDLLRQLRLDIMQSPPGADGLVSESSARRRARWSRSASLAQSAIAASYDARAPAWPPSRTRSSARASGSRCSCSATRARAARPASGPAASATATARPSRTTGVSPNASSSS